MKQLIGLILILMFLGCTKERIFERPSATAPQWTVVSNDTNACLNLSDIRLINGTMETTDSVNWFLLDSATNSWLLIGNEDSLSYFFDKP